MRIPNLNSLRAFEAAARLLSFKDAAAELHVSPSAVSQLIRGLELELGATLFQRGHRQLGLTAAGQVLQPALRTAFRLMREAAERVRREPDQGLLTVSTTAFFAETWLAPRLAGFTDNHPDLDVHVTTDVALANLAAGDADVAIRHGLGGYPGMQSDLLVAPAIIPVAAPSLVARQGPPATTADLVHWPKVHDGDRGAWALWFVNQGIEVSTPVRGPSFDDAGLLKAAALAGHGAALLPAPLVAPLVAAGDLIEIGPAASLDQLAYYLVVPKAALDRPKVAAFRTWIIEQAA
jgi:LysR family transcriptional regulator, glycine cleavage system transcriptional activator